MGRALGLGFEEAPMFDLIMWGKISPSFVAVAAAGVCVMWDYNCCCCTAGAVHVASATCV